MSSREEILGRLQIAAKELRNQGASLMKEPVLPDFNKEYLGNKVAKFMELIDILHGQAMEVDSLTEVKQYIDKKYPGQRVFINIEDAEYNNPEEWQNSDPHDLEDIEFALFQGTLAVAENGAIWFTEEQMGQRVAPYICQQMGVLIKKETIHHTMAEAYEILKDPTLGFGGFIAGPSKTADIEQSLVTGAHGPRGLVVFIL